MRHNYGIDGEYILSVGSIQPRKNLARLVKAYASLRDKQGTESAQTGPGRVSVRGFTTRRCAPRTKLG